MAEGASGGASGGAAEALAVITSGAPSTAGDHPLAAVSYCLLEAHRDWFVGVVGELM